MSTTVRTVWLVATALAAVSFAGDAADLSRAPGSSEADAKTTALERAYLSNREAFREFSCRFVVKRGRAFTTEDALAGKLSDVVVRNGLWVVDGARQRYELICEDPKSEILVPPSAGLAKDNRLVYTSVKCLSETFICDDVVGLTYAPKHLVANIGTSLGAEPRITVTPLSYGIMGVNETSGPIFSSTVGSDVFRRYGGVKEVAGARLEALLVGKSSSFYKEFSLDAKRGFLPVEVRYYSRDGVLAGLAVVTKIRKCPNNAYFPERSVTLVNPDAPGPKQVWVIELRDLTLTRPAEEELAIELVEGTEIVEPPTMLARVRLSKTQTVGVKDLGQLLDRCRDARRAELQRRIGANRDEQ